MGCRRCTAHRGACEYARPLELAVCTGLAWLRQPADLDPQAQLPLHRPEETRRWCGERTSCMSLSSSGEYTLFVLIVVALVRPVAAT